MKDEEWPGIAAQHPVRQAGRQGPLVKVSSVKALSPPVLASADSGGALTVATALALSSWWR